MAKVVNAEFFKQKKANKAVYKTAVEKLDISLEKESGINISDSLISVINDGTDALSSAGRRDAALEMKKICNSGFRNRFTVAVVGEFSRGKSTFINALLDRELLPVGDMPTTAVMTRIRYAANEAIVHFNKNNQKEAVLPIKEESWDGLVADNFGKNDPSGTVLMGVSNAWLKKYSIELMDTPGAGDLEEKRAQLIGDALLGCDGAVITVSAIAPLSMTEKLFIEERLISRKTPFLMLIITKLDLVDKEERAGVVNYIKEKLASWNMNIPVYIPYNLEMDTDEFDSIIGMDKIKDRIVSWVNAPERLKLTEDWIKGQAAVVIDREITILKEQLLLAACDSHKRDELIREKKLKLKRAEIAWEDLRQKMLARCNKCYAQFVKKSDEYTVSITERLQYEVSHSNNPQKWWEEDYAYRVKIELTNMAASMESAVSRSISEDIKWFNLSLEHNFNTNVLSARETIYEKELFSDAIERKSLEFDDLDKKKNVFEIGTAVATLAGVVALSGLGALPMIATIGIGTSARLFSGGFFKKKIEEQRRLIKETVSKEIPRIVAQACLESEGRIKALYNDIIKSAVEKEEAWKRAQLEAIEGANTEESPEEKGLNEKIEALGAFSERLMSL